MPTGVYDRSKAKRRKAPHYGKSDTPNTPIVQHVGSPESAKARKINAQARLERERNRAKEAADKAIHSEALRHKYGSKFEAAADLAGMFGELAGLPYVDVQWALALLGAIGAAAAKAGDLGTARAIASDLMSHAKEMASLRPGDRATLVSAAASAGPSVVADAAAKLGMTVAQDPSRAVLQRLMEGGPSPQTLTYGSLRPEE